MIDVDPLRIIKSFVVLGIVLTMVPVAVYLERRVSAIIQDRVARLVR
jgi:NADH:ubiquinone oxidoreductase subunit H